MTKPVFPPGQSPPASRRLANGEPLGPQCRFISLRTEAEVEGKALDEEARTLALTFSSEYPVQRWFGNEVLSHDPGAADLSRCNDGAPFLFNHNRDDVIGVIESASIGADRKGHAVIRFAKTPRGTEMMGLVADEILRNISFMYEADDYVTEVDDPDRWSADDTYTARSWCVFEISLVTIPADPTVGVGRSDPSSAKNVRVETRARPGNNPQPKESSMKRHPVLQEQFNPEGGSTGGAAAVVPSVNDIRTTERERQIGIHALGVRWSKSQLAETLITGGATIEAARAAFLESMEKDPQKPVARGAQVDMSPKERTQYSMLRGFHAMHSNNWKEAGLEREVSNTIAQQLSRNPGANGIFIPTDLPFAPSLEHERAYRLMNTQGRLPSSSRAAYAVGAPATGGNLVATDLLADSFIEVFRNAMVTPVLGARFLSGLVGNVDIPRQITAGTASWVGEMTAGTESEATFDKVQLRPKNVTSWGILSRMMMMQANPAIEMLARADLLAIMALALDMAALSGTGTGGQPTGIVNQAGINSVIGGVNGKNVDFDDIIKLYTAPRVANASQAAMAFAMNSKVLGYLATLKSTTGSYLWDPQGGLTAGSPDRIKGKSYGESQQLRSNLTKGTSAGVCSEIIYGDWQELLIGEWGAIEVAINPYDSVAFKSGDVVIRAIQTADVGVRHAQSFSVMSDALTPGF